MKKLFLYSIWIMLTSKLLLTQSKFPDDVTFWNLPTTVKELRLNSLSIESTKQLGEPFMIQRKLLGSGFLFVYKDISYAVTNYHVIKSILSSEKLVIGMNTDQGKIYRFGEVIKFDSINDIAIIDILNAGISYLNEDNSRINQLGIGISKFADSSDFCEGQGILMIGYPLDIGAYNGKNFPVSRIGIIAQGLLPDNTFLIDGISNHGNSGSPIYSTKNNKLLGMLTGAPKDYITKIEQGEEFKTEYEYNSGLSICVSSFVILNLLSKK